MWENLTLGEIRDFATEKNLCLRFDLGDKVDGSIIRVWSYAHTASIEIDMNEVKGLEGLMEKVENELKAKAICNRVKEFIEVMNGYGLDEASIQELIKKSNLEAGVQKAS